VAAFSNARSRNPRSSFSRGGWVLDVLRSSNERRFDSNNEGELDLLNSTEDPRRLDAPADAEKSTEPRQKDDES
jgi:hypothetical protein